MNNLESIIEMRKTLISMNERLTPYSPKIEYQRYLKSLIHYKQLVNTNIARLNEEIDASISKSSDIIHRWTMQV
jgi:outer membrane protein assembly factor BamD (BamD/ComL family)